jgi:CheY-like chemotaxis protein
MGVDSRPRSVSEHQKGRLSGLCILVVDDHEDSVTLLTELFALHGARVHGACDPNEARAVLDAHRIDLIVTDIAMPRESGLRMMARLRESEGEVARTPAIAMSGQVPPQELGAAYGGLFQAALAKPFALDELVEIAARLLDR